MGRGLRPRKMFGQHFLIDGNLMRLLVESANLVPENRILEIGGATGGLTDLLAASVNPVFVVEIDRDLALVLKERFADHHHVTLLHADVLQNKHTLHQEVSTWLVNGDGQRHRPIKMVANLPYEVATLVVMNLVIDYPMVERLCFTVQWEVGQRITAEPDTKDYGPLSIISQTLCDVETIARVPSTAFWPRPKIDSSILRMVRKVCVFDSREELEAFVTVVRRCFEHRRKTLRSALGYFLDRPVIDAVCHDFDGRRRPQTLSVQEWVSLSKLTTQQAYLDREV